MSAHNEMFEWSDNEISKLIDAYRESVCLWNPQDENYNKKDAKKKAMENMSLLFDCPVREIKRKIHNLRNQVTANLRNHTDEKEIKWKFFDSLSFVVDVLRTARQGDISETSSYVSLFVILLHFYIF